MWPFRARVVQPPRPPESSTLTLLTRDPAWWSLPAAGLSEYEQASRRWAQRNAEAREAGCHCGAPATDVRYDHGNAGCVPVEFWSCVDHVDVKVWNGTTPLFTRTTRCDDCLIRGSCSWSSGPNASDIEFYCRVQSAGGDA